MVYLSKLDTNYQLYSSETCLWIMIQFITAYVCSNEPIEEIHPEPVILTESTSVCHCYNSVVSIYRNVIVGE